MNTDTNTANAQLSPFGAWVSNTVRGLAEGHAGRHDGYLDDNAAAVAAIAQLAHASGHEIGADPSIMRWTVPDMHDDAIYPRGVQPTHGPTAEERAAHAAVTLFAVHQQSQRTRSMHTDAHVSLGRAVGAMAPGNFNEKGIRSTFDKLQTSSSWPEMVRHARHLIALLKREDRPLNYGLFAQDLLKLRQSRERANAVRLRWGRDYQNAYLFEKSAADRTPHAQ